MSQTSDRHLRLFPDAPVGSATQVAVPSGFAGVFQDFENLTGWVLGFAESAPSFEQRVQLGLGGQAADGKFFIDDLSPLTGPKRSAIDRRASEKLAESLSGVLHQLHDSHQQLRAAQAELATHCSLEVRPESQKRQNQFLQQLLKSAVELLGYQSAGLSVLDEQGQQLLLRITAGSHFEAGLGKSRELRQGRGDVAALAGNVVLLSRQDEMQQWGVPVPCRSAVCVPVSSLDNVLGTLWLVSDRRRVPSDHDLNLLEIIAGRVACELERRSLQRRLDETLHAAQILYQSQPCEPLSEREITTPFSGITLACGLQCRKGGAHHEPLAMWRVTSQDKLAILVAELNGQDARRQMHCLQTCFDVLAHVHLEPAGVVSVLQTHLRQHFDAPAIDALACLQLDPLSGECSVASCGDYRFGVQPTGKSLAELPLYAADRVPRFLPRPAALVVTHPRGPAGECLLRLARN